MRCTRTQAAVLVSIFTLIMEPGVKNALAEGVVQSQPQRISRTQVRQAAVDQCLNQSSNFTAILAQKTQLQAQADAARGTAMTARSRFEISTNYNVYNTLGQPVNPATLAEAQRTAIAQSTQLDRQMEELNLQVDQTQSTCRMSCDIALEAGATVATLGGTTNDKCGMIVNVEAPREEVAYPIIITSLNRSFRDEFQQESLAPVFNQVTTSILDYFAIRREIREDDDALGSDSHKLAEYTSFEGVWMDSFLPTRLATGRYAFLACYAINLEAERNEGSSAVNESRQDSYQATIKFFRPLEGNLNPFGACQRSRNRQ